DAAPRAVLGGGAPAQVRRRAPGRALAADRGSVRRVMARARPALAVAAGLLACVAIVPPRASGAGLLAGAASVEIALPEGTPLGAYGTFPRRAWFPHVLAAHAFWLNPARGVHDAPRARALVLESGATRLLFLTVDLVGVDPGLLGELRLRLERDGSRY